MSFSPPKKQLLEALLFSTPSPLTLDSICQILEVKNKKTIEKHIGELNQFYYKTERSFFIDSVSGGFQIRTLSHFMPWIKKLQNIRTMRFSPALLQTLSIIAYRQPIIRAEIESIRTVDCSHTIRQLLNFNLIKIYGRSDLPGKPILYSTTDYFLEVFGYNSLEELPKPEEIEIDIKKEV